MFKLRGKQKWCNTHDSLDIYVRFTLNKLFNNILVLGRGANCVHECSFLFLVGQLKVHAILIKDELNEFDVALFTGKDERCFPIGFFTANISSSIKQVIDNLD